MECIIPKAKTGVCVACPQEQSERLLVMYPSTLIILSEENDGLFYKVTPLILTTSALHGCPAPNVSVNKSL